MWVKVCGITREQDAHLAAELGASALGFVFWPASRRFIQPDAARRIVSRLPAGILAIGVFVNHGRSAVEAVARHVGLGGVQLHGDEDPAEYAGLGTVLIKAVPLGHGTSSAPLENLAPEVTVLVDGAGRAERGGAGHIADWSRAAAIAARRRTILAGGLTPASVTEAIAVVRPFGVDVSSGVEAAPGIKDAVLLQRFMEAASATLRGGTHT